MRLTLKVFFFDSITEEEIPSDSPREMGLTEAIDRLRRLDGDEAGFIGLVDDDDNCIQFAYVDYNKWYIDIPFQDIPEHLRYANLQHCISIVKKCYDYHLIKLEYIYSKNHSKIH